MVARFTGVTALFMFVAALAMPSSVAAQQDSVVTASGDSLMLRLIDADLRSAVQALSRYLDRPLIFSGAVGARVTVETPRPIARADVLPLLRGLLESQNLELFSDTAAGIYRMQSRGGGQGGQGAAQPSRGPQTPLQLFVIHLRHAKASDVAATVNALYGRASAFGEPGARSPGSPTLSQELTQQQVPPAMVRPDAPGVLASARNASLAGEVTIVPDVGTNNLLIRASRIDFALIQAAVNELDVRPLQVLVEVLIAEVRRDRGLSFGVTASLPLSAVRGQGNTTVEANTTGAGLTDFVVKLMGISSLDVNAIITAAASRGDATIVSRPVVIASNNETAEINVGSQRPFIQVSRVLPTDNTARDQVVQYKDVGTRLRVTPTISRDGYVMLAVVQEVNAATAEQQFNAPVISTRALETRLLIRDRQTVVLGGITDRQREVNQEGIPFLSSIPWIGGLFGRSARRSAQTELFLFLTPRIITSDADADSVTAPMHNRATRIQRD